MDAQKFARWDVIEYEWSFPKGDNRSESRRIQHRSLSIVDRVPSSRRQGLIAEYVEDSLEKASASGRSLTLIRPRAPRFRVERKSDKEFGAEAELFRQWHQQEMEGLFGHLSAKIVPYEPSPFRFKFEYSLPEGMREGTCQDWEIEATFLRWRRSYGEAETLRRMLERFGEEYPAKGFVFAMGTHKAYPQWLINGIIRLNHGAESKGEERLL